MLGKPFRVSVRLLFACLLLLPAGTQANTLSPSILKALRSDELQCCKQVSGKFEESCHLSFVANLRWCEFRVSRSGKTAFLIENRNTGFCGSAGCALHLFIQRSDGSFAEVFDEVGALESVKTLKSAFPARIAEFVQHQAIFVVRLLLSLGWLHLEDVISVGN